MARRTDRKIPYGIADFKRIRNEGLYSVDKTEYLAKPEMKPSRGYSDFCLFPERVYNGDVRDSYIIELKYSKPTASDAEIAVKAEGASRFSCADRRLLPCYHIFQTNVDPWD